MYGATTFSTNGFCVITAARISPMVDPIAKPMRNSCSVTQR